MTTAKHFALTLALTFCAFLVNVHAQTPRMATVNITPDADKVHISTIGDAYEMRVDVADEQGDVVFQSGAISGQQLDWNMKDSQGERVTAGAYLVTVTFRTAAGKLRKRVEQVTVEEAEKASPQATAAPNAAQAAITGAGTTGKIAKFTGAATIANSIITESAGKINVGLAAAPISTLTVKTASENYGLIQTNGTVQVGTWAGSGSAGTQSGWFGTKTNHPLRFFAGPSGAAMTVTTDGYVGIGTYTPSLGRLHVEISGSSRAAVYGKGSTAGLKGEGTLDGVQGVSTSTGSGAGIYGENTSGGFAGYFTGKVRISNGLAVVTGGCTGCSPPSDRNLKANFSSVNSRFILDRLATLSIQSWNYKSEDTTARHVGPMAQDFRAAFGLGTDDHTLNTVDAQGVTMAAIQGLYQQNQELTRTVQQQSRQIGQLQSQVNRLQRTGKQQRKRRR